MKQLLKQIFWIVALVLFARKFGYELATFIVVVLIAFVQYDMYLRLQRIEKAIK